MGLFAIRSFLRFIFSFFYLLFFLTQRAFITDDELLRLVSDSEAETYRKKPKIHNTMNEINLQISDESIRGMQTILQNQPRVLSYKTNTQNKSTRGTIFNPPRTPRLIGQVTHDRSLPSFGAKQQILDAIEKNQVVIVSGPTGCGKTTQVPQYILEYCSQRTLPCRVLCSQPRRVAAKECAKRVSKEQGVSLGGMVGFQIRFDNRTNKDTTIAYMTR